MEIVIEGLWFENISREADRFLFCLKIFHFASSWSFSYIPYICKFFCHLLPLKLSCKHFSSLVRHLLSFPFQNCATPFFYHSDDHFYFYLLFLLSYHFFFFSIFLLLTFSHSFTLIPSDINRRMIISFIVLFDTPAFKAEFNSPQVL